MARRTMSQYRSRGVRLVPRRRKLATAWRSWATGAAVVAALGVVVLATALTTNMTQLPPTDFSDLRLNPSAFEEVLGVEGQAQLMLEESQWTRNFHDQSHFGTPSPASARSNASSG